MTVTCEEGLLQPLTVPCDGECNFWPGDKDRNSFGKRRSHVKCDSGDQVTILQHVMSYSSYVELIY